MKLKLASLEMPQSQGSEVPQTVTPRIYLRFGENFFWLSWTTKDEHSANDKCKLVGT